ncbi:extracellular solute-binding protein family 5 [Candidatus Vecturithrix granuli]|uniref:Extracellular solute-binding protein family 5 n=1 Tax=Vecturithrix granuli TaxID=1499967 RepID=A0A0S6WB34_VECG1|nr:extracellular solute-binding protein family 5 [Candidatus Vecturithrix granuli]
MSKYSKLWGKILIVLLVLLCLQALYAAAEKVLYLPADGGLDNLDPRVLTSTSHQLIQFAMFEPLVRTHAGDLLPGMAESWEISEDGTIYTFHLRDAKWSDGKPVTGGDFVHAFVRMFQICPASPIYDDIYNGAQLRAGEVPPEELGVKAPDDKTVVITLKNPAPYFMGLIASSFGAPGREDLAEKFGDGYGATAESLASCGPFILTEWKHEDMLVMVKNPDYWNADKIKLDKVVIYVLPDEQARRNMFDNGEIDYYIPRSEAEAAEYEAKGLLIRYVRGGVRDLHINRYGQNDPVKAKILSNPNFMKAISYAIDRKGYIDNVLQGNGVPATVQTPPVHAIYPGKTWGEVSTNYGKYHPETADLAKSKEYMDKVLQDMGYTSVDQLPEFDFLTSMDPEDPKDVASYLLSVFSDMGLKIKVNYATGKQFYNNLYEPALAYDFARAGWGPDYDDPHTYMGYWTSASTDMGVTFDNAEFDELLDKANKETDLVKRAAILNEAEALFSDIAPCIPIMHFKGAIAVQPWVKGLTTAISGLTIDYIYADVEK